MKVGRLSPREEGERVKAAREAVGPDVHLMLEHPSDPSRHASLLLRGGRLTGAIYLGAELRVAVSGVGAGLSLPRVEHGSRDLPCGLDLAARDATPSEGGASGACDSGVRADVLVLYTDAAISQAGGETPLVDWINWAVADSNAIYASSGIDLSLRLAGTGHAAGYLEDAASMANDLYALRDPVDGKLDQALPLRDATRADFVTLVRADGGGACGIAWLLGTDPNDESYAYSVTALGCFTNRTFTHELGHNMGCCHAPGDGGGCTTGGVFPYSVGNRFTGAGGSQFRTVMAYAPGTRIPRFSSPTVLYDGVPTGLVDRDNASSIGITRFTFASFRCESCVGDLNDDSMRDGADLAALLGAWGASSAAGDLTGDGNTDGADLAVMLGNWGVCP